PDRLPVDLGFLCRPCGTRTHNQWIKSLRTFDRALFRLVSRRTVVRPTVQLRQRITVAPAPSTYRFTTSRIASLRGSRASTVRAEGPPTRRSEAQWHATSLRLRLPVVSALPYGGPNNRVCWLRRSGLRLRDSALGRGPPRARHSRGRPLRQFVLVLLEQLHVRVRGQRDRGVAQLHLGVVQVAAAGLHERGRAVAQVAQVDGRQVRRLDDPLELTGQDVRVQ